MRSITTLLALGLGVGLGVTGLTGCGIHVVSVGARASSVPAASTPTAVTTTTPTPAASSATPTATPSVHFATSEAAMTYLAAAYNSGDETDLRHVTTPSARADLDSMRSDATNLRLVSCTADAGRGDYTCVFDHDFVDGKRPSPDPEGPPPDGSTGGWAQLTVAPASSVGWYATVLESCD